MVRRVRGEECVDESVSSTSNDLFSAGEHRAYWLDKEANNPFIATIRAYFILLIL